MIYFLNHQKLCLDYKCKEDSEMKENFLASESQHTYQTITIYSHAFQVESVSCVSGDKF